MRQIGILRSLGVAALLALVQSATAANLVLESPDEQVTVVELYTSHGCNSCPPADAWLRRLIDHPDLWHRLVPLSFHVDYWDYLGWSDRFARPDFSQRQRNYRRSGGLRTVYTPGMLLNGQEWRGWLRHTSPPISSGESAGKLRLELEPSGSALLAFHSTQAHQTLEAHMAILGFGVSTAIGGGENAGKTLKEDFVVLGMSNGKPVNGKVLQWKLPQPDLRRARTERLAIVAWVSTAGNPRPLQTVAGWLP